MAVPEYIRNHVRRYVEENLVPVLPSEIKVVSFEVVSWLITIHMYQHAVLEEFGDNQFEDRVEKLVETLPPRQGEPWQVVPSYHRRDPHLPVNPEGEVVYAV